MPAVLGRGIRAGCCPIVVALIGVVVACSSDETTTADEDGAVDVAAEEYAEALAASWSEAGQGAPLSETQTNCVATGLVELVGVDALAQAGISPTEFAAAADYASLDIELPDDPSARMGDALAECDLVETLEGVMIDGIRDVVGLELPPDAVTCLSDQLDDRAVATAWGETFVSGSTERIQAVLAPAVGGCPAVVTAVLIAQAPAELTPDAEACVVAFVQGNPELVLDTYSTGDATRAATQELARQVAPTCPGISG
jgi:hypothetical protein